jgi:hypothetical protein
MARVPTLIMRQEVGARVTNLGESCMVSCCFALAQGTHV